MSDGVQNSQRRFHISTGKFNPGLSHGKTVGFSKSGSLFKMPLTDQQVHVGRGNFAGVVCEAAGSRKISRFLQTVYRAHEITPG